MKIYNDYNDQSSLYLAAYLYDEYLDDVYNALKYYREYKDQSENDEYIDEVNSRINSIASLLEDEIDMLDKNIFYIESYSFLNKYQEIDSVKKYVEVAIEGDGRMMELLSLGKKVNSKKLEELNDFIQVYLSDIELDTSNFISLNQYIFIDTKPISMDNPILDTIINDTVIFKDLSIDLDINELNENLNDLNKMKDELFPVVEKENKSDELFVFNQSIHQYFYFVKSASIDDVALTPDDWMVAYNNDVVVGARKYVDNGNIDIPIMGFDDSSESTILATEGYCMNGDIPAIKIHRTSGEVIDMNIEIVDGNLEFKGIGHSTVRLNNK